MTLPIAVAAKRQEWKWCKGVQNASDYGSGKLRRNGRRKEKGDSRSELRSSLPVGDEHRRTWNSPPRLAQEMDKR